MLSFPHLLILLLIVLLLFGRNRIPGLMGDIGKGIHSLREGLKGDEAKTPPAGPIIDQKKDPNA